MLCGCIRDSDSRGNGRFPPGCTHTSYYMVFGTERFPQKVAFQGPRQFGTEETVKKTLPFVIHMLMLGFWEVPFVHNTLICHANLLCFNLFWCVCSRTTKAGNGMQWVIGYNNFPLCQQMFCHNRCFNCIFRCSIGRYWCVKSAVFPAVSLYDHNTPYLDVGPMPCIL